MLARGQVWLRDLGESDGVKARDQQENDKSMHSRDSIILPDHNQSYNMRQRPEEDQEVPLILEPDPRDKDQTFRSRN